ncbi:MAG: 4'-phosphopantetheinyl transferase superfamily protein [Kiritimatiellia bacterium]
MNADLSEAFGSELVLLGAADDAALAALADRLVRFLDQAPGVPLRDVAYTCAKAFPENRAAVLAVVARSVADLRGRLVAVAGRIRGGAARVRDKSGSYYFRRHLLGAGAEGRLAFVFPGAASFYPDMLRDLAVRFRDCRLPFDELEAALAGTGQFQPSAFVFPPAPYYRHDADVFTAGGYAEAVVSTYSANAAMARILDVVGVRPDGAVGFAGGDLNALVAGGLFGRKFDRKRRLEFLRETYKVVNNAVSHAGLPKCVLEAVLAPRPEAAEEILATLPPEKVQRAFLMSPKQWTLAIAPEALEEVQQAFAPAGIRGMRLQVDRPFNTPWCGKILPLIHKLASHWVDERPQIPVYSCGTTEPLPSKTRKAREAAANQWVAPVRFGETIRRMHADGFRVFLEAGPRGVMTGVVDDVLKGEEHLALAADSIHRAGLLQLQHTLGALGALGAPVDITPLFAHRRPRALDFDAPLTLEVRSEREMPLSREFPRMVLFSDALGSGAAMVDSGASVPGRRKKGAERAAALAARARRQKQFEYGAIQPLVSSADVVDDQPGIREIVKTFSFREEPFLADFALGSSQLEHQNGRFSNELGGLRGLVLLHPVAGAEIMAEVAQSLMPNRHVVAVEDLQSRRRVAFKDGLLRVFVRAERTASDDPSLVAVRVQLREDAPNSAWTWPVQEGTFLLAAAPTVAPGFVPPPLGKPREVHWTDSDIYPDRLFAGANLRGIRAADRWSEVGLDYEVEVPSSTAAVAHTKMLVWTLNPQLLAAVTDGFPLWRSHERFPGAFSFPFRVRRIVVHTLPMEGMRLHCYLRNTGVTPNSLIVDVLVSDGNGKLVLELRGYEELTERVPDEYRQLLLSPVTTYLTRPLAQEILGSPATQIASAVVTDVPYKLFERNEEIWLKTLSHVVLNKTERGDFADLSGSTSRRTEWLFGRIAAKEAVRRFLQDNYQARWCPADVQIWRDDSGKPHPLGRWKDDHLTTSIDLAIAHTAQFVVAVVASNARVGVDVESRDRDLSEEFTRGVFTPEELELAVRAVNAPSAVIRFWCAKEAVSKALGTGIRYSPRELIVDSFQAETGEMTVRLTGQWLEPFKQFTGRAISVSSTVVKGHVLASCFIPDSMFA